MVSRKTSSTRTVYLLLAWSLVPCQHTLCSDKGPRYAERTLPDSSYRLLQREAILRPVGVRKVRGNRTTNEHMSKLCRFVGDRPASNVHLPTDAGDE